MNNIIETFPEPQIVLTEDIYFVYVLKVTINNWFMQSLPLPVTGVRARHITTMATTQRHKYGHFQIIATPGHCHFSTHTWWQECKYDFYLFIYCWIKVCLHLERYR